MARRRARRKTRRTPRAVSLIGALELYALTAIMTKGLTNYDPWEFITSGSDIMQGLQ